MRPLLLEFKGINSFSEHTIIDFRNLTKNGIFGIFGDTGSGKSTILDCINFALYGNVERSKEKTDIINYRCNSAEVKFVFDIVNEGARKKYTVERTLKRDKNGTHKAMLYEDDGENSICLADKTTTVEKKIVEILGVSDEDFRKCIALPQGEFSQFVQSAPRERLLLIERLFSLSKYGDGLKEKLSNKIAENESAFQNISGKLSGYEDDTEEKFCAVKSNLKAVKSQLTNANKALENAVRECDRLKNLSIKRKELEEVREKLLRVNSRKVEIEKIRATLNILPFCNEAVEVYDKIAQKASEVQKLETDIANIVQKLERKTTEIKSFEEKFIAEAFDEKIAKCVEISANFRSLSGKPEKLKELLGELEGKRAEYRKKEQENKTLLLKISQLEKETAEVEQSLANYAKNDIEQLFNVNYKGAVLKNEYVKTLDYFARFRGDIEVYKDDSPLYLFVKSEADKMVKEYKDRILQIKDFDFEKINGQLKAFQNLEEEKEKLRKDLSEKKENLQSLKSQAEINAKELNNILSEGNQLKARADEIQEDIVKAFGSNHSDLTDFERKNENALQSLKEQKQSVLAKTEVLKAEKTELEVSLEKLKVLHSTAAKESAEFKARLDKLINDNNLSDIENCKKIANEISLYADAEKELSDFDKQIALLTEKIAELEKIENINNFSERQYDEANGEREGIELNIKRLTGDLAVLTAESENIQKRLAEKQELLKEFNGVKKQRDLLYSLKEVIKGNKFLEYIAGEYLFEISAQATVTLLKLTDGRYFLTYKDNNFFIGDNYDCGNLRGVNTLSGGETFLVSLSLALALSQAICAKSLKSIEFFFLDEGFGTLDSSLLDTVVSALEKLKSSSFIIGVISHVEELKNRIDSKITINKATESHGSTVSISC